jgi:hypothetical protein
MDRRKFRSWIRVQVLIDYRLVLALAVVSLLTWLLFR